MPRLMRYACASMRRFLHVQMRRYVRQNRERVSERERERERELERERESVCVCERERERERGRKHRIQRRSCICTYLRHTQNRHKNRKKRHNRTCMRYPTAGPGMPLLSVRHQSSPLHKSLTDCIPSRQRAQKSRMKNPT